MKLVELPALHPPTAKSSSYGTRGRARAWATAPPWSHLPERKSSAALSESSSAYKPRPKPRAVVTIRGLLLALAPQ